MPMNAPPEFNKAMEKYSSAKGIREKIMHLEEALRYLPKHKGTENMRKQLMRRLAELRRELLKERKSKRKGRSVLVPKMGYQVVLWGFANSGKSYILNTLTGANTPSTPRPLETHKPTPGIMESGGGRIQLVELPSYFPGFEDSHFAPTVFSSIRAADHLALVLREEPEEEFRVLVDVLRKNDIFPNKEAPPVKVERQPHGGIKFLSEGLLVGEREEFLEVLQMFGIHNAVVVPYGRITPNDLFMALDEGVKFIPAIIIFNGDYRPLPWPWVVFKGASTKEELFRALNLVRVFTKPPKGEVSSEAVVLPKGSTVHTLSERIGIKFRQARLWKGEKFINVGKDYVLKDGDIIELR